MERAFGSEGRKQNKVSGFVGDFNNANSDNNLCKMAQYITSLTFVLFTLAFVFYFKWQKVDDDGGASGRWHRYGAYMRYLFAIGIVSEHFYPSNLYLLAIVFCFCQLLYEIGINVIALHQKPLYNGTTSVLDESLGKVKWYIYFGALVASILAKIFSKNKNKKS